MPSSHGSDNSNSSQTAHKERSEIVQQADQPGGLPDDEEGDNASDNTQDPNDGPATEMLGKYSDFLSNPVRAKKYMKHLDKEGATHDVIVTQDSIAKYIEENDPVGFSAYCEESKLATPHKTTPGGVWLLSHFAASTAAQSKRKSKKDRQSRTSAGNFTVNDQTQKGAPSTAADN